MTNNKLYNIDKSDLELIINNLNNEQAVYIRFTADWCVPCKTVKPLSDDIVKNCSDDITYIEIDIDESIDLFTFYKSKKLIKGIPAMYLYYKKNDDVKWYIPDYSVSGANKDEIQIFKNKILKFQER